jgi:hypothetical protein
MAPAARLRVSRDREECQGLVACGRKRPSSLGLACGFLQQVLHQALVKCGRAQQWQPQNQQRETCREAQGSAIQSDKSGQQGIEPSGECVRTLVWKWTPVYPHSSFPHLLMPSWLLPPVVPQKEGPQKQRHPSFADQALHHPTEPSSKPSGSA